VLLFLRVLAPCRLVGECLEKCTLSTFLRNVFIYRTPNPRIIKPSSPPKTSNLTTFSEENMRFLQRRLRRWLSYGLQLCVDCYEFTDVWGPDDGGSTDLWNVGKLIPVNTALQLRRQPSSKCVPTLKDFLNQSVSQVGGDVTSRNGIFMTTTGISARQFPLTVEVL
jgi:hypothetical protein